MRFIERKKIYCKAKAFPISLWDFLYSLLLDKYMSPFQSLYEIFIVFLNVLMNPWLSNLFMRFFSLLCKSWKDSILSNLFMRFNRIEKAKLVPQTFPISLWDFDSIKEIVELEDNFPISLWDLFFRYLSLLALLSFQSLYEIFTITTTDATAYITFQSLYEIWTPSWPLQAQYVTFQSLYEISAEPGLLAFADGLSNLFMRFFFVLRILGLGLSFPISLWDFEGVLRSFGLLFSFWLCPLATPTRL